MIGLQDVIEDGYVMGLMLRLYVVFEDGIKYGYVLEILLGYMVRLKEGPTYIIIFGLLIGSDVVFEDSTKDLFLSDYWLSLILG